MTRPQETIPDYLRRMAQKAAEKGENPATGWRTTGNIAEYFGLTTSAAYARLKVLERERLVENVGESRDAIWRLRGRS